MAQFFYCFNELGRRPEVLDELQPSTQLAARSDPDRLR